MTRARLRLVVLLAALAAGGCFSPRQPPCAFSCAEPPHLCPASYTCGADLLCYKDGTDAACLLTPPDAGPDGAREGPDAPGDGAADAPD